MALRHVWRCLSYLSLMLIAGWLIAGCVIQEPRAITEIGKARKALDDAKKAGAADRAPDKFAALEKRYLQARGVYYSCNDAEAIRLAQSIIADLSAPVAVPPPPPPANRPPVARLTAPAQAQVGEAVTLDASASSDPDNDPLSYTWDFGDGTPPAKTTFARTTHSYAKVGNYTARVTVDDGKGGINSATAPIAVSQKFVLTEQGRKVLFDFNKATLKPEAKSQLAAALQALKEQPGLQTQIVGHTDGIGSDAYNMKLSQRRADSVATYLGQNGVPRQSIRTEARGKREPVAPNTTAEGRAQNRRVEITVSPGS
ncbi:MAG TPA: OmpA family protein [Candidatus Saccharimonadia bacterium]|nr:OmpA family protein [Candidatus Saccharimonadia bacterium]